MNEQTSIFFLDLCDVNLELCNSRMIFKLQHILAYGLLGCILEKKYNISLNEFCIRKNKHGMPFLYLQDKHIEMSISHSGEIVVVAVSNQKIGVDIEKITPIKNSIFYYSEFFSEDEMKIIYSAERKAEIFTRFWTRKEALLKHHGKGIEALSEFSYFDEKADSFMVNSLSGNRYIFSYSYDGDSVIFFRYDMRCVHELFRTYYMITNDDI